MRTNNSKNKEDGEYHFYLSMRQHIKAMELKNDLNNLNGFQKKQIDKYHEYVSKRMFKKYKDGLTRTSIFNLLVLMECFDSEPLEVNLWLDDSKVTPSSKWRIERIPLAAHHQDKNPYKDDFYNVFDQEVIFANEYEKEQLAQYYSLGEILFKIGHVDITTQTLEDIEIFVEYCGYQSVTTNGVKKYLLKLK